MWLLVSFFGTKRVGHNTPGFIIFPLKNLLMQQNKSLRHRTIGCPKRSPYVLDAMFIPLQDEQRGGGGNQRKQMGAIVAHRELTQDKGMYFV